MSDPYFNLMQKQYRRLEAEKRTLQAEFSQYEADGLLETERGMDLGQALLDKQAQINNLTNEFATRQQTAQPVEISEGEFLAMSPERMLQNPGLVDRIFAKSKYYTKDQWSDPEVAKRVRDGLRELQIRKANGQ